RIAAAPAAGRLRDRGGSAAGRSVTDMKDLSSRRATRLQVTHGGGCSTRTSRGARGEMCGLYQTEAKRTRHRDTETQRRASVSCMFQNIIKEGSMSRAAAGASKRSEKLPQRRPTLGSWRVLSLPSIKCRCMVRRKGNVVDW